MEEVKEEGPKEMSLDEWKAMQDKERAKVQFNIRKANEGADWNKGFVLHKSKAEVSLNRSCVFIKFNTTWHNCINIDVRTNGYLTAISFLLQLLSLCCFSPQDKKDDLIEIESEEVKVKSLPLLQVTLYLKL